MMHLVLPLLLAGCTGVEKADDVGGISHGVATTVVLHFTPDDGGETLSFAWSDPESDGAPIVDDILLPDASDHNHHDTLTYTLAVELWDEQDVPAIELTGDVVAEAETHQVFFTGSAVEGPATGENSDAIIAQEYADADADGLPLGLTSTITTLDWGEGALTVTFRHLPLEEDAVVKVDGLAEAVAAGGFASIGGVSDAEVTFNIAVE